jgi:hypothetical protein
MDTQTPQDAPDAPDTDPAHDETTGPTGDVQSDSDEPETFDRDYVTGLRDEAASHRVRARDLEATVDRLRDRLLTDNLRHLAAEILADPTDLLLHVERETLLDVEGEPDPDVILAAARQLVKDRPHLASRRPTGTIEQGALDEPNGVDLARILRERAG